MFQYFSPRISWLRANVKGKIILDVGFVGSYRDPVANRTIRKANPKSTVISLDINQKKVLQYKFSSSIVASGFSLPLKKNSVNTVVLAEILEHVRSWQDLIEESFRVLKKGGSLIITTPNPFSIFRILRNWLLTKTPQSQQNLKQYFGADDHLQFIEPLSLLRLLAKLRFKTTEITTTNLSIPYLPKVLKDPDFKIWPLTRIGTYTCIKARKL